ncbi:IS4 family transposase [Nostoc sp. FACHB-190]|nr:IS4 family transposase [Nostoc sp. FACHB-190]
MSSDRLAWEWSIVTRFCPTSENRVAPPPGEKAICWLLLTTLVVNDFEQASQCLNWYSYRWLIERYHYCLKSGCQIEKLQLEEAERIERALATYAIVAWRLLWLTYEARCHGEQPVEGILERHEWQSLYCMVHKTNQPPNEVPTLEQCIRWIASLGGFLGRKGDGDPGVIYGADCNDYMILQKLGNY